MKATHSDPNSSSKKCAICNKTKDLDRSIVCSNCLAGFKASGFIPSQILKLYNEAFTRENVTVHRSFDSELVKLIDQIAVKSKPLLNLGCGKGALSEILASKGYNVIAIDFSKTALSEAKKKSRQTNFCLADASQLPFCNGSFETVISLELIEHLFDPKNHLIEVKRVLRKNGAYLVKTPNKWISKLYYTLNRQDDAILWHPSSKSYFELRALLQECGFQADFKASKHLAQSQLQKLKNFALSAKALELLPLHLIHPMFHPSLVCIARKRFLARS